MGGVKPGSIVLISFSPLFIFLFIKSLVCTDRLLCGEWYHRGDSGTFRAPKPQWDLLLLYSFNLHFVLPPCVWMCDLSNHPLYYFGTPWCTVSKWTHLWSLRFKLQALYDTFACISLMRLIYVITIQSQCARCPKNNWQVKCIYKD